MTGRSRHRTHAGIPHGSTTRLYTELDFYYQWNSEIQASRWNDQSQNGNHAAQSTALNQGTITADGAMDLEKSNAQHYDFTQIDIGEEEGFTFFIVLKFESTDTNACILGMNTAAHFMEFKGGADSMRCKLANTNTEIAPGDGTANDFSAGTKMLVTLQREEGEVGLFNVWKNGILLTQDEQASNADDGEFKTLGVRSGDRYFDGIIYDVAFTSTGGAKGQNIEKINEYFTSKHGIAR